MKILFTLLAGLGLIVSLHAQTPNLTFGSGNAKVDVFYPCNTGNSCYQASKCHVYLRAATSGTWKITCGGGTPQMYYFTNAVCVPGLSCNVEFTSQQGGSSSGFFNAPASNPEVNADFNLVPCSGMDGSEDRTFNFCAVSTSTSSDFCPITKWEWIVTYSCPNTPIVTKTGPGPHTFPVYGINITIKLTVTAGCTVKTRTKVIQYLNYCNGFAESDGEYRLISDLGQDDAPNDQQVVAEPIRLAPNPASSQLAILNLPTELPAGFRVEFYDALGRNVKLLRAERIGIDNTIDLADLVGGLYFVVLRGDEQVIHSQKLIVE